jgi:hypothetical protein
MRRHMHTQAHTHTHTCTVPVLVKEGDPLLSARWGHEGVACEPCGCLRPVKHAIEIAPRRLVPGIRQPMHLGPPHPQSAPPPRIQFS